MPDPTDAIIQSFGVLNYSGMLFNKGNTKTPFSTLIGGRRKITNHVEFVTGQEYTTIGGTQPAISETDSLTAPLSTYITRQQKTNVTQIFQESVYISYAKQSNMGTLSGVNIGGQQANPANELDFQVAARMEKIAQDIEATFIKGAYAKAANDATANKSRGMTTAITTNVFNLDGAPLRVWDVAQTLKLIYDANGRTNGLYLWVDPVTLFQLNADAEQNGNSIVPASYTVNGLSISTLLTPLGQVNVYLGEHLPEGTALLFNPSVIAPVEQPTPGKGNFFLEELAKTGAGTKYQIFGQIGLDHGPEWMHAKIVNISTDFEKPKAGKMVYFKDTMPFAQVLPQLDSVTLGDLEDDVQSSALVITYVGTPVSPPTLAYQWQIGNTATGEFTDIQDATQATITPATAQVGKFIRVKVTASVTALGTVYSNAKQVAEASAE